MPKKTKKEKLRALLRKEQLQKLHAISSQTLEDTGVKNSAPEKTLNIAPIAEKEPSNEDLQKKKHFLVDLRVSLIVISFIIGLEIIIYFASIRW